MPEIIVGLAPRKVGFYDQLTNTHLTLDKSTATITYSDDNVDVLKDIAHAILCKIPALILYEGTIPVSVIEKWENRYRVLNERVPKLVRHHDGTYTNQTVGTQAFDRSGALKEGQKNMPNALSSEEATLFSFEADPELMKGREVGNTPTDQETIQEGAMPEILPDPEEKGPEIVTEVEEDPKEKTEDTSKKRASAATKK